MCSETQFCLRWNNFGSTMTSALNKLHQLGDFVDVTLAVQGIQLKAHKVVLSACSPYFRDILKSNPCQHPVIILREVTLEDLESVLTFMYEGEVNVTQPRLHTFMRLAEALQVRGLTENANPSSFPPQAETRIHDDHLKKPDVDVSNSSTLDLTTKSNNNKTELLRSEPSYLAANHSFNRINYSGREQDSVHLRLHDSPPTPVRPSKRRRSSEINELTIAVSQVVANEEPDMRNSMHKLLEVKMEPDEYQDEGKENGSVENVQKRLKNRSKPETVLAHEQLDNSPINTEEEITEVRSAISSPSILNIPQRSSPIDKRSSYGLPKPVAEKQSGNYQPEFPQDPTCQSLPYPCPFCEKSYTSWGFRRRHIKGYHTGTPQLPCKWCFAVLPSHQDWENHVTKRHNLTLSDARNGILILEEAHMVLQIAQPTRIDTLMELIKNKKEKDKEMECVDVEKDKNKVKDKESGRETSKERPKSAARSGKGEASH